MLQRRRNGLMLWHLVKYTKVCRIIQFLTLRRRLYSPHDLIELHRFDLENDNELLDLLNKGDLEYLLDNHWNTIHKEEEAAAKIMISLSCKSNN